MKHILINKTSRNITLDNRTHFLTSTSLAEEEILLLGILPPPFIVMACSWSSKSYIFRTIDLSSDHWASSAKPKAQHIFLGPLSLHYPCTIKHTRNHNMALLDTAFHIQALLIETRPKTNDSGCNILPTTFFLVCWRYKASALEKNGNWVVLFYSEAFKA